MKFNNNAPTHYCSKCGKVNLVITFAMHEHEIAVFCFKCLVDFIGKNIEKLSKLQENERN